MKHLLYIAVAIAMLFLTACGNSTEKPPETAEVNKEKNGQIWVAKAQFEQGGMKLGKLTKEVFPEVISTTGIIDVPPQNRAVISAVKGGYIKDIPLLVGDKVTQGQALVTIENPEYINLQQEFLEINEQLSYLKSEYQRQKILIAEEITSQKNFLKAESEFRKAEATRNGLDRQLQMLNISTAQLKSENIRSSVSLYAPISGSITRVDAVMGSFVASSDEILEIVDNDHIHLELAVFEKDVLSIKKGQKILFQIPESSEETFAGSVYLIGTSIGSDRTIKIHGHLKNEEQHNFLRGMFVDAQILVDTNGKGLFNALPEDCIIEGDMKRTVLVLKEQNALGYFFEPVFVKTGKNYMGFTEVSSEVLSDTSKILIKGAFNLIQGE